MEPASKPSRSTVRRLLPRVLQARLSAESGASLTLLDVREPFERSHCAIVVPPSVRDLFVPMGQVTTRVEEIRQGAGDVPIVVYCHHGVRSMAVGNWLAGQGFADVFNLEGGIDAWAIQVDPATPRY